MTKETRKISVILDARAADESERTVPVTISTEAPVSRWDFQRGEYDEILTHTPESVDLSRAPLPLQEAHDTAPVNVGLVEQIRVEGARLRGLLRMGEQQRARELWPDIVSGIVRNVSVGYEILDDPPIENGRRVVNNWRPYEVSLVGVGADAAAGIGRSKGSTMPEDVKVEPAAAAPANPAPATPATIIDTVRQRSSAGFDAGAQAATERINAIDGLTRQMSRAVPDLASDLEALSDYARNDASVTVEQYRSLTLELIGGAGHPLAVNHGARSEEGDPSPIRLPSQPASAEPPPRPRFGGAVAPGSTHRGFVQAGGDGAERACRGMELSMLERAGTRLEPTQQEGNHYRGWSILDIARECLTLAGHDTRGWSSERIARAAIAQGQGRALDPGTAQYVTADFPAVTENVMTKRVHDAFAAAEVTWDVWCSSIEVPDFKQFSIPRISQIASLPTVAENVGYTDLTRADAKENATLTKQGGLISYSWEAIVNDDQRMFSSTATDLGEAAARTLDEKAYAVLTTNANMGDTNPLFSAPHLNTGTAALDLPAIVTTRTAIARQTDDGGNLLGIILRFIIVPEELRDTADNLAGSEYLPWDSPGSVTGATAADTSVGGAQRVNTVRGTFTTVATVRLTNAKDWFAAAGRGTVELAFLNGNRNPAIFREEGWNTDSLNWKIRHPSVAYPVDWRGLYFNDVAP